MDELKLLIEMVADLPQMALWVLIGFFIYKVIIIGSVFGIIKLAINKFHDWLTTPKETLKVTKVKVDATLSGITISDCHEALISEILRLKSPKRSFIHSDNVDWLRSAIDEKRLRDENKKRP